MSKISYIRGIVRAVLGNGNSKPGESPFCQQVIRDNKEAHERLGEYIANVDERSANADERIDKHISGLRVDLNSRLDQIVTILRPN